MVNTFVYQYVPFIWINVFCTSTLNHETFKVIENRDQNKKYLIHGCQRRSQKLLAFAKTGPKTHIDDKLIQKKLLGVTLGGINM